MMEADLSFLALPLAPNERAQQSRAHAQLSARG
jgi:hypothetical protein